MAKPLGLSMGTQILGYWLRQQPTPCKLRYLTSGRIQTQNRTPLPHILAFTLTNWATLAGFSVCIILKNPSVLLSTSPTSNMKMLSSVSLSAFCWKNCHAY